ncbi:MAG: class I SAM-dependent methyltransferase [Myxococcales bacterium]|nr:class I SAM-dependent methyltransferase [Myxococcales bacterium]
MALRSNSFNFEPLLDVARPAGAACPLSTGSGPVEGAPDPKRALFLRLKDRMRLFVTRTCDFDDGEIAQVRALGQFYVDRSAKQWPDDFATDLMALAPAPECQECPRRVDCPGGFRAREHGTFADDEARVRSVLRGLTGGVLDVGAGDAPYAAQLGPRALSGDVDYLAVDPDGQRLSLLQARLPWAKVVVGSLGDLPDARRFDHVLFLRSLNHLPDARRAVASACDRLAVGGTLLLVDDVAFGLVRSAEQLTRAQQGSGSFEHYRNDSSADVRGRLAGLPLRLVNEWPIRPGGSNQWLLEYQRE